MSLFVGSSESYDTDAWETYILKKENAKLRTFIGGGSIVTDYWKDEDGTMHVLTTDGEHTYEYMRGGLADENAKLRELVARMAKALGIDCEWADPNWCKSPCVLEFGCWPESDHTEIRCPAWATMRELGVEVDDG